MKPFIPLALVVALSPPAFADDSLYFYVEGSVGVRVADHYHTNWQGHIPASYEFGIRKHFDNNWYLGGFLNHTSALDRSNLRDETSGHWVGFKAGWRYEFGGR